MLARGAPHAYDERRRLVLVLVVLLATATEAAPGARALAHVHGAARYGSVGAAPVPWLVVLVQVVDGGRLVVVILAPVVVYLVVLWINQFKRQQSCWSWFIFDVRSDFWRRSLSQQRGVSKVGTDIS